MILGLKKGDIQIVQPQEEWKSEFINTQKEVHKATGIPLERIEHVGSTAIEGIKAKPMIDLAVGVEDVHNVSSDFFKNVQKIGFYRLKVERADEVVLAKFRDETFDVKTHIIHLLTYQGAKWNDLLSFRDQLNSSEELRKEYEAIKQKFIDQETGDMNDYTDYKEHFVREVLRIK